MNKSQNFDIKDFTLYKNDNTFTQIAEAVSNDHFNQNSATQAKALIEKLNLNLSKVKDDQNSQAKLCNIYNSIFEEYIKNVDSHPAELLDKIKKGFVGIVGDLAQKMEKSREKASEYDNLYSSKYFL